MYGLVLVYKAKKVSKVNKRKQACVIPVPITTTINNITFIECSEKLAVTI